MTDWVLCLSPHCDDIAYSLAGRLLRGREAGPKRLAVAVFTRSMFAPYASPGLKDRDISALRRQEDELFCAELGLARFDLQFDEAPLRGYSTTEALFTTSALARTDRVLNALTREFIRLAAQWSPVRVYVPLGIGGHVDHLLTKQAAIAAFSSSTQLLFYEDLPYAGELTASELEIDFGANVRGMTSELTPIETWLSTKLRLLSGYESQVAQKDLRAVATYTNSIGGERVWR